MRPLAKILLVLVFSVAASAFLGRILLGRRPPAGVVAAGAAVLFAAILALDVTIGW